MVTTIQISSGLRQALLMRKMNDAESYENVIWDLLEDSMELSDETKKEIAESRREIKEGKFKPLAQVKKGLGF
ncbi:MAG: hypothetical protein V1676_05800 [Candidatus Diapherotrites archaeon]